MAWVKFDDGFPEHPKIIGLSDAAFRLHVEAVSYCNRQLTDGLVLAVVLPRITSARHPVKVAAELVSAGVWEATEGGWWIHDYLDYQPSKQDAMAVAEGKSVGGSIGNHRRWHKARGVTDPTCRYCIADPSDPPSDPPSDIRSVHRSDSDRSTESGPNRPSRPVPTRPDISSSSSSGETALHAVPSDDDEWIDQVIAIAADRRLERARSDGKAPHTPSAWLHAVRRQIRTDELDAIADIRRRRPDLDPDGAVLALEGCAPPRPPCKVCGNLGVLEQDDGTAVNCWACKAAA